MSKYRKALPQLDGGMFITDGGMETVMVFQEQIDLAHFAAIDLLRRPDGPDIIANYCGPYLDIAASEKLGIVLETPTWRASQDWSRKIGFDSLQALSAANKAAVAIYERLRRNHETCEAPIVISGCVGPRGDGYDPGRVMTATEAEEYHAWLIKDLARTPVDLVSAITMNNVNEALGIAQAAMAEEMPVVISFTVETDGRLPTGQPLGEAIAQVDLMTGTYPAYYMINCAHPTHFAETLSAGGDWLGRLKGIRANASKCSHAELDEATELDDGNPHELGVELAVIRRALPHVNVLGGCCGTDHRHIAAIAAACRSQAVAA